MQQLRVLLLIAALVGAAASGPGQPTCREVALSLPPVASLFRMGASTDAAPLGVVAPPAKRARVAEPQQRRGQASELPALIAARLFKYMDSLADRSEPVVRLRSPDEIKAAFREAGIPMELEGQQLAESPEVLAKAVDVVLKYSVRTGHPLFFNQLNGHSDESSIAADWVIAATSTNCHTYEVAPVFTLIEKECLRRFATAVGGGWAEGHDGLFVPGGSLSNLYAMHLAHNRADPDLATRGAAGGPRCVAFTSDQSHYSYLKSAKLTCLGSQNLIMVRSDGNGRMDPEDLEAQILKVKAEGGKPFFVGATSGTTVLGAYDPLEKIAEICKRHGLWMHVDGCWGGAVLFSDRHRHNMQGVELADSVCWNPHKMIGSCLQCSVFLTKHVGMLSKTNSTNAAYLFMKDKLYAEMDVGDKTIQCGRHGDQLKMWMMFKSLGDEGIRHTVDHCFALAAHFTKQIRSDTTGAWQLVYEPSCSNVCFWYVPKQLRPFNFETATKEQTDAIHKVAPLIKREMQKLGDAMIGFQALNGRPNFFRIVFCSKNELREADIEALVHRMGKIGDRVSEDIRV